MSADRTATSAEDTAAAFGGESLADALAGRVQLSDALACAKLLRSRRTHRLDLNLLAAARREAIDLAQARMRDRGERLKRCRDALLRLDTAIGADTAAERDAGVDAARDALALALGLGEAR